MFLHVKNPNNSSSSRKLVFLSIFTDETTAYIIVPAINAAYQYGEENSKGSIEKGKAADFVILDCDPLEVAPMDIRNIRVIQTIKDGECIYRL